ncbi:MAG: hypothetical protein QXI69_03480 [Candidatus Nitrosocaldus sp.]
MLSIRQIVIIGIVFMSSVTATALATHVPLYSGCRWWSAVEHVQYNYSSLDTLGIPRSTWVSELDAARQAWNGHSRFTLYEAASNPHTVYAGIPPSRTALAVTTTVCLPGYLQDADTVFNNTVAWATDGRTWPDFRRVAVHEFGHWVRLKDTSTLSSNNYCYQYTVMYDCFPVVAGYRTLFEEDKQWLRSIYGR